MRYAGQEDFLDAPPKPSLNSAIEQRTRRRRLLRESLSVKEGAQEESEQYTPTEKKMIEEAKRMSLVAHLEELRRRIIICLVAIAIGAGVAYYYIDIILAFLVEPAGKLYYMKPTEAFFTYMKVAFFAGFLMASPLVLYHLWAFIIPGLTKGEKRLTNWILPMAIFLFFTGLTFSYFLVLPAAIKFFIGFSTEGLEPLFSIGQYLSFIISFILPFGFIFELPLVVIIGAKFNLISSAFLKKQRKMMIFLSFVIGAAISPTPDMFSQTMIALPMILLYEFSLFFIRTFMKK